MMFKKYEKTIRSTFFYLCILTLFFYIYDYFDPLFFPGLKTKLTFIAIFFGFVYAYLYLNRKRKKIGINFHDIRTIGFGEFEKETVMILGLIYIIFLIWAYFTFTFKEFIFFILLLYIPFSYIFELNPKVPILIALILLVSYAFTSTYETKAYLDEIAIYIYYFLVVGLISIVIDFFGREKKYSFLLGHE
ncbi:MAG: hypothetical protein ISS36_03640 [Candidatus Aenigmarchaeota archaeon]|nr:hypothetical protein [Candidatus Aenigmarchaeota archaeon]